MGLDKGRKRPARRRANAGGTDPEISVIVGLTITGLAAAGSFLNGVVNLVKEISARKAAKRFTRNKLSNWAAVVKRLGQQIDAFDEFMRRLGRLDTGAPASATPTIGTLVLSDTDLKIYRDFVANLCRITERANARSIELIQHFEREEEDEGAVVAAWRLQTETERLANAVKGAADDFNKVYPELWETRDLATFLKQARALALQLSKVEENLARVIASLKTK